MNFLLVKIILILVHGVEAGREGLQRLSNAGTTAPSNFKMSPVIFNHYSESDAAADKKFILKFSISVAGASASSNDASFDDFQQRSTLKDSYHGGNILMTIMVDSFQQKLRHLIFVNFSEKGKVGCKIVCQL